MNTTSALATRQPSLQEQIARHFYAGRVRVGVLRPSKNEVETWRILGVSRPGSGDGDLPAYSNSHGAISVPRGETLFGLKPGEFTWVEQTPFIRESTQWAPVDGQPAHVDMEKRPRPIVWHLAVAPGLRQCGADYPNIATTDNPSRATCPVCLAFHLQSVDATGIAFIDQLAGRVRDGRKDVTRRLVTGHTSLVNGTGKGIRATWPRLRLGGAWADMGPSPAGNSGPYIKVPCEDVVHRIYSRRLVGDVLWVRERWRPIGHYEPGFDVHDRGIADQPPPIDHESVLVEYGTGETRWCPLGRAEATEVVIDRARWGTRWSPPMHMPRWAARTYLEVTSVGVERLHDITHTEIRREGLDCPAHDFPGGFCTSECPDLRRAWREGWDAINGGRPGGSHAANPWLWVLGFRVRGTL